MAISFRAIVLSEHGETWGLERGLAESSISPPDHVSLLLRERLLTRSFSE